MNSKPPRVVIVDNNDSFTYNLVDMLGVLGATVAVLRNSVTLNQIAELEPTHLVISPGPGSPPRDTGVTCEAIKHYAGNIPILGVCLGHQAIGVVFGAAIVGANRPMHGKQSLLCHNDDNLFAGIPETFTVGRYHSLVVDGITIPGCLEVIATSEDDHAIMALRHRTLQNVYGVQFHPESLLTADTGDVHTGNGAQILRNFLAL